MRYWVAMNASAFDAAAHSALGFSGVAVVHAAAPAVAALDVKQLGTLFLVAFGKGLWSYLKANPVPAPVVTFVEDNFTKLDRELAAKAVIAVATRGVAAPPAKAVPAPAPAGATIKAAIPGEETK